MVDTEGSQASFDLVPQETPDSLPISPPQSAPQTTQAIHTDSNDSRPHLFQPHIRPRHKAKPVVVAHSPLPPQPHANSQHGQAPFHPIQLQTQTNNIYGTRNINLQQLPPFGTPYGSHLSRPPTELPPFGLPPHHAAHPESYYGPSWSGSGTGHIPWNGGTQGYDAYDYTPQAPLHPAPWNPTSGLSFPLGVHPPPTYPMPPLQGFPGPNWGQNEVFTPYAPVPPRRPFIMHPPSHWHPPTVPIRPSYRFNRRRQPPPREAAEPQPKPPISSNSYHIRRLTVTATEMISCAKGIRSQSQELRSVLQTANVYDSTLFEIFDRMAEVQVGRQRKTLDAFDSMYHLGFGKSKNGRHRLRDLKQIVCRRKAEMFRFKKYVEDQLDQALVAYCWTQQEARKMESLYDKVSSMESLGQRLLDVAYQFTRELLKDFVEASEEEEGGNIKGPEITEKDLLPNQQEEQESGIMRKE